MIAFKQSCLVFWQFLVRRFIVKRSMIWSNAINYTLLYPTALAIQTGYIQATSYFGQGDAQVNTAFFAGMILLVIMLFTFKQNIELLFDFEQQRYIDYQITLLNPFLVLLERIIFTGLYTFFIALPFYPMAGILLPTEVDLSNTNWIQVIFILFAGSMCFSAYHLLAACTLNRTANITTLWFRINLVVLNLGGLWIPWYVMYKFSKTLGYLVYLNPAIYLTEGLKGAVTGNPIFLPFGFCIAMLYLFTVLLTTLCWLSFKRRVDCV